MRRQPTWPAISRSGPALIAAILALPFALHQNAWFEWGNSLWLLETQTEWVGTHGLPSPYLHAPDQVFYLFHLFYAGALTGVLAYPSLLFGAWPVFLAVTVAAFVVAQQSVAWFARSLGVDRALAGLLGLGFVTAPYVVALLYGRGAWAELVAASAATLAVAGVADLLTSARPRRRAVGAVIAGIAVVAATHSLTLLFGVSLATLTLLLALSARRAAIAPRAALTAVVAAALGVGLVAFVFLPNLWLSRHTLIAQPEVTKDFFRRLGDFHSTGMILRPWPAVPASEPANSSVYVQTAGPLLAWLLVALVTLRRHRPSAGAVALGVLGVVLVVMIVNPTWWLHLPTALGLIQFPFRLVTWLTFVIVAGCALVLRGGAERPRWLAPALVAVIGVQVVSALAIAFGSDGRALPNRTPLHHDDISAGAVPGSFDGPGFAQPLQFRLTGSVKPPRERVVARERLLDPPTRITLGGSQPAGTVLGTNVADSPLVRYEGGARKIARDRLGFAVLQVSPHAGARWEVTVSPRSPLPVVAGRIVSVLSVLAILGWLLSTRPGRRIARG
jgi:hypothetical protein